MGVGKVVLLWLFMFLWVMIVDEGVMLNLDLVFFIMWIVILLFLYLVGKLIGGEKVIVG